MLKANDRFDDQLTILQGRERPTLTLLFSQTRFLVDQFFGDRKGAAASVSPGPPVRKENP